MPTRWFRNLAVVILLFTINQADLSAQAHLIRYQGQAVDTQSVPLEGPYTLTFRLYSAQTGGAHTWQEVQSNVVLTKGHFSVLLGQVTPLPDVDWSQPCWLGIQVNQESELSPRQRITSVPVAIMAERLTQAIAPTLISPQGSASNLDADMVDGKHAADLLNRANHIGIQPASTITGAFPPAAISPQGSGSGLNADSLDGKDSASFATNLHQHPCSFRTVPWNAQVREACTQSGEWCVVGYAGDAKSGARAAACDDAAQGSSWTAICCR